MNRFEAMTIPRGLGVCDGCREELATEDAYCATCAELNRRIEERYERRLTRVAEEERALKEEALYHARRAAALFGSLPKIDGVMPESERGLMAFARKVWNAIF